MFGITDTTGPAIYMPYSLKTNALWTRQAFVVRMSGADGAAGGTRLFRNRIAVKQPVVGLEIFTLSGVVNESIAARGSRAFLALAGLLIGVLALMIASTGVSAALLLSVRLRYREIAIRRVLGAQDHQLVLDVCKDDVTVAFLGVAGGLAVAYAGSSWVQPVLFGIDHAEPGLYITVAAAICLVVLASIVIPGVVALRTSIADALRGT